MKPHVMLLHGGEPGDVALAALRELDTKGLINLTTTDIESLRSSSWEPDIVFSASYSKKIPEDVCKKAKIAAVNIHTGLLPKQRGANPLNWALIWGDTHAGVTIHKITNSFDAGDIYLQLPVEILETDTIVELRKRCLDTYRVAIQIFFTDLDLLLERPLKQNQAYMTYGPKRYPEDSELNLEASAREIYNLFRSCHPTQYPAFVMKGDKKVIVENVTPAGVIIYKNE